MFKILLFLSLLSLSTLSAKAQLMIGVQGGGNLSTMDFNYNVDYQYTEVNYTPGLIGGIVVQYMGSKHTGVQAEINFSQKGWVEKDTTSNQNLKYTNSLDYIEMPVLTYISMGAGDFRGVFTLGPYIGYALNRTNTLTDMNTGETETYDYTLDTDRDNRIDFGLIVGFGFEYNFPFGKIAAEARYSFGFGDLDKEKVRQSEVSQYRVLGILLRYTVPLNPKAAKAKTDPQ